MVGIEVPNRVVSTVLARDVIDSPEFVRSKSKVSFAVGKDIGGNRIIGDIGKLPHLAHCRYNRFRQVGVHEFSHYLASV